MLKMTSQLEKDVMWKLRYEKCHGSSLEMAMKRMQYKKSMQSVKTKNEKLEKLFPALQTGPFHITGKIGDADTRIKEIYICTMQYGQYTPSSTFQPTQAGRSHTISYKENFDEGVLIAQNALYSKIHLQISTLRFILWVPKWSGLNGTADQQLLRRTTKTALGPRFAILSREKTFYEYH